MSVLIEVDISSASKPCGSALIDAGRISGYWIPSGKLSLHDVAPPADPIVLFYGDGRELSIWGVSVHELLSLVHEARTRSEGRATPVIVLRGAYKATTVKVDGGFDIQIRYVMADAPA